ncbi:MAG: transcription repressor NadR [Acholeplasma sp.]|nr:transcription repressor NadR [Acholeplasma sp.]
MNGEERRKRILLLLNNEESPLSASFLAKKFNVSRQVIVGDIALLRALGNYIEAQSKGYVMLKDDNSYSRYSVIVKHDPIDTKLELDSLIDANVIIEDVTINHPVYGLLRGYLHIKTHDDVTIFLDSNPNLLSSLTDGVHVHTLLYKDKKDLDNALSVLQKLNFLYID